MTFPHKQGEPPDLRQGAVYQAECLLEDAKKLQDYLLALAKSARGAAEHLKAGGAFCHCPSPSSSDLTELAARVQRHAAALHTYTDLGFYSESSGARWVER